MSLAASELTAAAGRGSGRAARACGVGSLRPFGSRGWFPAPPAPCCAPPRSQLRFGCRFYSSPGAGFSTVSPGRT